MGFRLVGKGSVGDWLFFISIFAIILQGYVIIIGNC